MRSICGQKSYFSWVIVILMFLQMSLCGLIGVPFIKPVWAAGTMQRSITLNSSTNTVGYLGSYAGIYDKVKLENTDPISIDMGSGKLISKITITTSDNKIVDVTPPGAVNSQTWVGTISISGDDVPVYSFGSSTQGYYAWNRYMIGDPHGIGWYESGGSCPNPSSSSKTESINGVELPVSPNCKDTGLTLSANRKNPYRINETDTTIPSTIVDDQQGTISYTWSVDVSNPIYGPLGLQGYSDFSTTKISVDANGADDFIVHYSQAMDHPSGYEATLADPDNGSRQMVYFAAFTVDITSKTYIFPDHIDITYKDAPTATNLTGNITAADACILTGKAETFMYTVANNGSQDATTTVTGKILIDGTQLQTFSFPSIAAGAERSGTLNYAFQVSGTKVFTISIDQAPGEPNTSDNTLNVPFTANASCAEPGPSPEIVDADFTILKPTINYGDSNVFQPAINVTGGSSCAVQTVDWNVAQQSITYTDIISGAYAESFQGPPYPHGMGGGTVSVSMKVITTCGTIKTAGPKSFTIIVPTPNSPPVVKGGWFQGGNSLGYPEISTAVVGDYVDLGIVHDPTQTPNTPYDPDGDGIICYWDFDGSSDPWISALKTNMGFWEYDEHFKMIKADTLGIHRIYVTCQDTRGAALSPQPVTLNVVNPNPIPVITLPPKVVEGRAFTPDISCANSYSPYPNRSITSCDWHGTKESIYPEAGSYNIILDVTDSAGVTSLQPAAANLNVQLDIPPVAQINNPGYGVRNIPIQIRDGSYSPDGDPISEHWLKLTCDTNNDGSYADEAVIPVEPDSTGSFTYSPTSVGKCNIHVHVREGLGYQKAADQDFTFEVLNQSPEADFAVSGSNFNPPDMVSTKIPTETMLNDAAWQASSLGENSKNKDYKYSSIEDALETGGHPLAPNNTFHSGAFLSVSNNNAQVSVKTWYCSDTWSCLSGPGDKLTPTLFSNYGYATKFVNPWSPNQKGADPNIHAYVQDINYEANLVWYSFQDSTTTYGCCSEYHYVNYVYRISDLEAAANAGTGAYVAPIQEAPFTSGHLNNWAPNPVPSMYILSPARAASPALTFKLPVKDSRYGDRTVDSRFTADYAGNLFKYSTCVTITAGTTNCTLQKTSPDGSTLWSYALPFSVADSASAPPISYVSKDDAFLVINYNEKGKMLFINNINGALIKTIDYTPSSNPIFYRDKVSYETFYRAADDGIYHLYNYKLNFYDLITGLIVPTGDLATYSIYATNDKSSTAKPWIKQQLTNDGKVLLLGNKRIKNANGTSSDELYVYSFDFNGNQAAAIDAGSTYAAFQSSNGPQDATFTGDGDFVMKLSGFSGNSGTSAYLMVKSEPPPQSDIFNYGQLYNAQESLENGEISVQAKFNFDNFTSNPSVGLSARIQDNANMYRLEVAPTTSQLVKIVGGKKTVLDSKSYPIAWRSYVSINLKVNGTSIKGYLNGVPLLSATDSTFTGGYYGPFAEMPYVLLKNFSVTKYANRSTNLSNVAIVGSTVDISTMYRDPESDPAIADLSKWAYTQTEPAKFLDAGDGYSGVSPLDRQTVASPFLKFDKVGVYKVDYQLPDDPAPAGFSYPNGVFAGYRRYSDPASHSITIHRRPAAQFTVNTLEGGTLIWNDASYDPDRYISSANYSREATGIDYLATRGILQRKYSYTSPSGTTNAGQLIRPGESGMYMVREAVADEYGAWSDWYEQSFMATVIPANNPPGASLTFPSGSEANPSYVSSLRPTITWEQWDPDAGTVFTLARIVVKDEFGNSVIDRSVQQNTTAVTGQWTMDTALTVGTKYQIQVMVSDDGGIWSPWSNDGWLITNRPPAAEVTDPFGSQDEPTVKQDLRPMLTWLQTDNDPDTVFTAFQLQVWDKPGTGLVLDSGTISQSTASTSAAWQTTSDLPVSQKLRVRVRVYDGYAWSDWSADRWLFLNRAPIADFDWQPKPVWEGDSMLLQNLSSDADGDSWSSSWVIVEPDGNTVSFNSTDVSGYDVVKAGNYTVTLEVSDGMQTDSVTKTIPVAPLTIQAEVSYRPEWLELHRLSGHQTENDPKDFYSGEVLVLKAVSAPAPVDQVRAWLQAAASDGSDLFCEAELILSAAPYTYKGELFDESFQSLTGGLTEGLQTIHFEIRYANGVIKKQNIPVNIIGSVLQSIGVHRRR